MTKKGGHSYTVRVGTDGTAEWVRDMDRAGASSERTMDRIGRAATQAAGPLGVLAGAAGRAKGAVAGFAAGLSIGALSGWTRAALDQANALSDLSARTGTSAETLQAWREAAESTGASARQADDAISRFNRRLGLAQAGGGPAAAALRQLGVELGGTGDAARTTEAVFLDAVDALGQIDGAAERAAAASALFGDRAGPALANAVAEGRAAIEGYRSQLEAVGILMSQEVVDQAATLNTQLGRAEAAISQAFDVGLVTSFVDAVDNAYDGLIPLAEGARSAGAAVGSAMGVGLDAVTLLAPVLRTLADNADLAGAAALVLAGRYAGPVVGSLLAATKAEFAYRTAIVTGNATALSSVQAQAQKAQATQAAAAADLRAAQATVARLQADQAALAQTLARAQAERAQAVAQVAATQGTAAHTAALATRNQATRAVIATERAHRDVTQRLTAAQSSLTTATAAHTAAATASARATAALSLGARTAATSMRALSGAMALAGGWPGLILAAVAALYFYRDAEFEIFGQTVRLGDITNYVWTTIYESIRLPLAMLHDLSLALYHLTTRDLPAARAAFESMMGQAEKSTGRVADAVKILTGEMARPAQEGAEAMDALESGAHDVTRALDEASDAGGRMGDGIAAGAARGESALERARKAAQDATKSLRDMAASLNEGIVGQAGTSRQQAQMAYAERMAQIRVQEAGGGDPRAARDARLAAERQLQADLLDAEMSRLDEAERAHLARLRRSADAELAALAEMRAAWDRRGETTTWARPRLDEGQIAEQEQAVRDALARQSRDVDAYYAGRRAEVEDTQADIVAAALSEVEARQEADVAMAESAQRMEADRQAAAAETLSQIERYGLLAVARAQADGRDIGGAYESSMSSVERAVDGATAAMRRLSEAAGSAMDAVGRAVSTASAASGSGGAAAFAGGGVMTADGPLPLRRYAEGGIATAPQVAIFGEGKTPEAYVPLPDGRTIPVTLEAGAGTGAGMMPAAEATLTLDPDTMTESMASALSAAWAAEATVVAVTETLTGALRAALQRAVDATDWPVLQVATSGFGGVGSYSPYGGGTGSSSGGSTGGGGSSGGGWRISDGGDGRPEGTWYWDTSGDGGGGSSGGGGDSGGGGGTDGMPSDWETYRDQILADMPDTYTEEGRRQALESAYNTWHRDKYGEAPTWTFTGGARPGASWENKSYPFRPNFYYTPSPNPYASPPSPGELASAWESQYGDTLVKSYTNYGTIDVRPDNPFTPEVEGGGVSPRGFATGGVMTADGPLPLMTWGPMPLRWYDEGGIATSPQVAMFGEGKTPEAYVPLPDGRTIPVTLRGGGQAARPQVIHQTINVTVQVTTPDAGSFGRSQRQVETALAQTLRRAARRAGVES